LGCKLVGVGQKNNKTVAADGFKRQWLMVGHYSTIKRRRVANPTKKTEEKTRGLSMADEVKNQTRKSNAKVCRQNEWRVD